MERLGFPFPSGGGEEGFIHLGQGFEFDGDDELADLRRTESELATSNTVGDGLAIGDENIEPVLDCLHKFQVVDAGGEVHPDFIRVHAVEGTLPTMNSWRRCLSFGLTLLGSMLGTAANAQDIGLLLGVREDAGPYRTYWVARQGVSVSINRLNGPLWVRKGSEFWELGMARREVGNWAEDTPIAWPAGKPRALPELKPPGPGEVAGQRNRLFTFVNPSWVGMETRTEGAAEGIGQSLKSFVLRTVSIADFVKEWSFSAAFPGEPAGSLDLQIQRYLASISDVERGRLSQRGEPVSWALRHHEGQWRVMARLGFASEADRGTYADVPIEVSIPRSLVPKSPTVPDWTHVKTLFAETRDYVTALDGTFVVVLGPQQIFVYGARNGRVSRQMGFASTQAPAIVMTQWFSGDEVRKVAEEVRRLRSSMPN